MDQPSAPAPAPAQFLHLPDDLPVPVDDGACAHLVGMSLPDLDLPASSGGSVRLAGLAGTGRLVLYCYPRTGQPGAALPTNWDNIPGARGCTPEACAFRDHAAELAALGAVVYGVSTQPTAYQQEAAERLHLPFALLSDAELRLARTLRLPTFSVDGQTLLKRVTMVVARDRVTHVFYPVFPPDQHAAEVVAWLRGHPATA